jgi:hypothetical protein
MRQCAAQQATHTISIVALADDLVGSGLIDIECGLYGSRALARRHGVEPFEMKLV